MSRKRKLALAGVVAGIATAALAIGVASALAGRTSAPAAAEQAPTRAEGVISIAGKKYVSTGFTGAANKTQFGVATCPKGTHATGGGVETLNDTFQNVKGSLFSNATGLKPGTVAWRGDVQNTDPTNTHNFVVYAVCE